MSPHFLFPAPPAPSSIALDAPLIQSHAQTMACFLVRITPLGLNKFDATVPAHDPISLKSNWHRLLSDLTVHHVFFFANCKPSMWSARQCDSQGSSSLRVRRYIGPLTRASVFVCTRIRNAASRTDFSRHQTANNHELCPQRRRHSSDNESFRMRLHLPQRPNSLLKFKATILVVVLGLTIATAHCRRSCTSSPRRSLQVYLCCFPLAVWPYYRRCKSDCPRVILGPIPPKLWSTLKPGSVPVSSAHCALCTDL